MGNAAIPNYLGKDFEDVPPGHRFELYFEVWDPANWKIQDRDKTGALKRLLKLPPGVQKMLHAILKRQQLLADSLGDNALTVFAHSLSPFMTGMGMEHPLENGFAFLKPYGLPYLAGSGVKGVLRSAAEDLALGLYGDTRGWDLIAVWWLFGFEPNSRYLVGPRQDDPDILRGEAGRRQQTYQEAVKELDTHDGTLAAFLTMAVGEAPTDPLAWLASLAEDKTRRESLRSQGALRFWDVLPDLEGAALIVEIMTPHYSDYYQRGESPHDSGQPNPIPFLAIPHSSKFCFHVQCDTARLPPSLRGTWPVLLQGAFEHAYDWLGFGAKTAVGYGQMATDEAAQAQFQAEREERERCEREAQARAQIEAEHEARLADLSPLERSIEELLDTTPQGPAKHRALLNALRQNRWQGEDARKVAEKIQQIMQANKRWRPKSEKKNPSKDKEHQETLAVLAFLKGEKQ